MKTQITIAGVGVVWFGIVYSMIFASVGSLLSTIA